MNIYQKQALIAACAALTLCAGTASAQTEPARKTIELEDARGGSAVLSVTGEITAVDVANRIVSIKGPKGNISDLRVDPAVRNLEQVKVGDRVSVRYLEALTLTLKKDGKALPSSTKASDAARAKEGERPGGVVAEQVTVTAEVTAVDAKTGIVTLKGPKQVVDLHVQDPEQLKLIKVGDQIEAVYTQALAVSLEPAAAKK